MIVFLVAWSIAALLWWGVALFLLDARRGPPFFNPGVRGSISVFKPIPPIATEEQRRRLIKAIDSFVAQLAQGDELILGIDINEVDRWKGALASWRGRGTLGRIVSIECSVPQQQPNPKIAWLEVLAKSASCETWIWSDADVFAPPFFLDQIYQQLASSGANAVSCPYRIQEVCGSAGMLDALFVNLEMLPGILLLGRLGRKDFAYGAATAFSAKVFRARCEWSSLGSSLADDHKLGELLQPVALGQTLVTTFTTPTSWLAALQHYYRWQKTVRWCRPVAYASLLALLPAIGWTVAMALYGMTSELLVGLLSVFSVEVSIGFLGCRILGCQSSTRTLMGLMLWPMARALAWVLVWLPFPVIWSGRRRVWFSPTQNR